jgi:cytochrome c-type biogenesis protein CcmH/NrfG
MKYERANKADANTDPTNQLALFQLGLASMRTSQWDKAIARWEQLLKLNPTNKNQVLYQLGVSYASAGKKNEAKATFEQLQKTGDLETKAAAAQYLNSLQ